MRALRLLYQIKCRRMHTWYYWNTAL